MIGESLWSPTLNTSKLIKNGHKMLLSSAVFCSGQYCWATNPKQASSPNIPPTWLSRFQSRNLSSAAAPRLSVCSELSPLSRQLPSLLTSPLLHCPAGAEGRGRGQLVIQRPLDKYFSSLALQWPRCPCVVTHSSLAGVEWSSFAAYASFSLTPAWRRNATAAR